MGIAPATLAGTTTIAEDVVCPESSSMPYDDPVLVTKLRSPAGKFLAAIAYPVPIVLSRATISGTALATDRALSIPPEPIADTSTTYLPGGTAEDGIDVISTDPFPDTILAGSTNPIPASRKVAT